jgi:CRP-like cAMP-binding protein
MKNLAILQPGERTNVEGKPVINKILLSIPDAEYRIIRPHLEYLELPSHLTLYERSEKLRYVHFPNTGLVSLVVPMENGQSVEAGVVGNEGATGVPIVVGVARSPLREIIQIAGDGFRLNARAMPGLRTGAPQFAMHLARYAVIQGMQVSQIVACNRLHKTEQRLARWLLMAQDRVDSGHVAMTHDFLATMLGTNRPTVSSAAGTLQKRKCIEYVRGAVNIINRKKLESRACECYGLIQQFNGELGL